MVTFSPSKPEVNQKIKFKLSSTATTCVRWDFGDGNKSDVNTANDGSPSYATHKYNSPGTYTVKVYDDTCDDGGAPTATTTVTVSSKGTITNKPKKPHAGQKVTFQARDFTSRKCIRWDFGDGTRKKDTSPPKIDHIYQRNGRYKVRAYDNCSGKVTAEKTISVGKDARDVTYSPEDGRVNETLTFRARGFYSSCLKWDFGDGNVVKRGSKNQTHVYKRPGGYRVKVYDYCGEAKSQPRKITPFTLQVTILPDIRRVNAAPLMPFARQPVVFTAINFRDTCIKWNFGDGSKTEKGKRTITHTFKKQGAFTVTAYDHCGKDDYPLRTKINVRSSSGPAAPFSISFLQLRFKDGQGYVQTPLNTPNFKAYADIKYEGTGILQVQWLVDGKPFRTDTKSLSFAQKVTLDTVQGLPTIVPGMHQVTLRFIQPKLDFTVPVIRYFIPATGSMGSIFDKKFDIIFSNALNTSGETLPLAGNTLSAQPEEDVILSGRTENKETTPLVTGLLSSYVAGKLVDSQAVRNLAGGTNKPFTVSFQLPPATNTDPATFVLTDTKGNTLARVNLGVKSSQNLAQRQSDTVRVVVTPEWFFSINEPITVKTMIDKRRFFEGTCEIYKQWYVQGTKEDPKRSGVTKVNMILKEKLVDSFQFHDPNNSSPKTSVTQADHDEFEIIAKCFKGLRIEKSKPVKVQRKLPVDKYANFIFGEGGPFRYHRPGETITIAFDAQNQVGCNIQKLWGTDLENKKMIYKIPPHTRKDSISTPADPADFHLYMYCPDIYGRVKVTELPWGFRRQSVTFDRDFLKGTQLYMGHTEFDQTSPDITGVGKNQIDVKYDNTTGHTIRFLVEVVYGKYKDKTDYWPLGSFKVGSPNQKLPTGWTINPTTVPYIKHNSHKEVPVFLMISPGAFSNTNKSTIEQDVTIKVDLDNAYPLPKSSTEKRETKYRVILNRQKTINDFRFDSATVPLGETANLIYDFRNVQTAQIIDKLTGKVIRSFYQGKKSGMGKIPVKIPAPTVYQLIVTTPNGKETRDATVKVIYPEGIWGGVKPLISKFTLENRKIYPGDSLKLSYEFSYAESAELWLKKDANDAGKLVKHLPVGTPGKIIKGEVSVKPTVNETYLLWCKNRNGEDRKSVPVTMAYFNTIQKPVNPGLPTPQLTPGTLGTSLTDSLRPPKIISIKTSPSPAKIESKEFLNIIYEVENVTTIKIINSKTGQVVKQATIRTNGQSKQSSGTLTLGGWRNLADRSGDYIFVGENSNGKVSSKPFYIDVYRIVP